MGATTDATLAYAKKFSHYKDFYSSSNGLIFSRLGLGTYVPEPYWEDNYIYSFKESVKMAIKNGINFIDTASNYRYGQSEKEIGDAISELIDEGIVQREELIIASKGGFIPLEFPFPQNPYEWINKHIIKADLAKESEIELDEHCMNPKFLEFSLNRSLENLKVDKIDIYYLHNPEFEKIGKNEEDFYATVKKAFEAFEGFVKEGKIGSYGVATWNGLLYDEQNEEFISLAKLIEIAQSVGGENHHFKYLQVPFNLAKTTALTLANQKLEDNNYYTLVEASKKFGLGIVGSSSLLRMNLFKRQFKPEVSYILDPEMKLTTNTQLALQFVRSSRFLISSLFSSRFDVHVKHNIEIASLSAVPQKRYDLLYGSV